jgi:hypothetical protein
MNNYRVPIEKENNIPVSNPLLTFLFLVKKLLYQSVLF